MKKIFLISMLCFFSMSVYAQTEVTKFLGIPVDGYKSEMIQKLKAKGFTQVSGYDNILEGEFNGANVNVHVVTNNNKVCRIMVTDKNNVSEGDIKIRFNKLCKQFAENGKYLPTSISELSDEENISYEMSVNSKRYEASFIQLPISAKDTTAMYAELQSILLSKYTEEELSKMNMTDENKLAFSMGMMFNLMEKYSKNSVWFMINRLYGKYYITMYYDNEHNRANGEDL